jgi:hypothetical protein
MKNKTKQLLDSFVYDQQAELISLLEKHGVWYKNFWYKNYGIGGFNKSDKSEVVLRGLDISFYKNKVVSISFSDIEVDRNLDQEITDWLKGCLTSKMQII